MSVALTQTQRNQLFSLSQTTSLLEVTANRVNTGKKINDASDNPFLYFKATRLSENAEIFNSISTELETSLNVVKAAEKGLSNIRQQLLTAQSRLRDALAAGNSGTPGLVGQKTISGDPLLYTTLTLAQAFGIDATDKLVVNINAKVAGVAKAKTNNFTGATTVQAFLDAINLDATIGNATLGENVRAYITAQGGLAVAGTGSDPQNDSLTNIQFTFTDTVKNNQGLYNIFGAAVPQYTAPPSPTNPTGTFFLDTGQITANFNTIRAEAAQFLTNTLGEISSIARDSAFAGNNLLQGGNLVVFLNETGSSNLAIAGVDLTNGKLGLNLGFSTVAATGEFVAGTGIVNPNLAGVLQSDVNLNATLGRISSALDNVEYFTRQISGNLDIIKNRVEFSKEIANVFQASADQIVSADVNEESANLIALQTRQQLALQALSITNQAQQGALRLF